MGGLILHIPTPRLELTTDKVNLILAEHVLPAADDNCRERLWIHHTHGPQLPFDDPISGKRQHGRNAIICSSHFLEPFFQPARVVGRLFQSLRVLTPRPDDLIPVENYLVWLEPGSGSTFPARLRLNHPKSRRVQLRRDRD